MNYSKKRERRRQMAMAVAGGKSVAEVAEEFDVRRGTVVAACFEAGEAYSTGKERPGAALPQSAATRKAVEQQAIRYHKLEKWLQVLAALLVGEKTLEQIAEECDFALASVSQLKQQAEAAGVFEAAGAGYKARRQQQARIASLEKEIERLRKDPSPSEIAQRNERLIEDVKAGASVLEVAKKYDLSVHSVRGVLSAAGVETQQRRAARSEATKLRFQIVAALMSGKRVQQIIDLHGIPATTVYRAWRQAYEAGIPGLKKPPGNEKTSRRTRLR